MNALFYRGLCALGLNAYANARARRAEVKAALAEARAKSPALTPLAEALASAAGGMPGADEKAAWAQIEARRAALAARHDTVDDVDYGAGNAQQPYSDAQSRAGVVTKLVTADYVRFSKDAVSAQALFAMVRRLRPASILELGTCVGISGSYLAAACRLNGRGRLVTIEGSPPAAALARETFAQLGLAEFVVPLVGPFQSTLEPALARYGPFELVFVDGHHDGKATVRYFRQIKPRLAAGALVVFDDVIWNADMARAWDEISRDADVADFIRLGGMGVVVMRAKRQS